MKKVRYTNTTLLLCLGSRGPAVLDDFTASYGYKFFDNTGYGPPSPDFTTSRPYSPEADPHSPETYINNAMHSFNLPMI